MRYSHPTRLPPYAVCSSDRLEQRSPLIPPSAPIAGVLAAHRPGARIYPAEVIEPALDDEP